MSTSILNFKMMSMQSQPHILDFANSCWAWC